MSQPSVADAVYEVMLTRRAIRAFTGDPVPDKSLTRFVAATRCSSNAGSRHVHKFLITRDPARIALIRAFSPVMLTAPPALILILTDHQAAAYQRRQAGDDANMADVGTSAHNMMNMAHALALGTCPVTSFGKSGVAGVLGLAPSLRPELILMVGHPRPMDRNLNPNAPRPVIISELTYWEEAGHHAPR